MKRLVAVAVLGTTVHADPIRLRADALSSTASPAGLVTLEADGEASANVSAEAVVWTGGGTVGDASHADVLVVAIRARTADGRESVRLGRFVESLGALHPVQIDGAAARVVLPYRLVVEAYSGIPVVAGLTTARTWDWIVGARVAERIGESGSVGVAYAEQRDDGLLDSEEVGFDGGATLGKHDDVGAKLAYDLANPGVAEAALTAADRRGALRSELYLSYIAASHLLPATSLFSVLGDVPAERAGTTLTWRAAPRLDVGADLGIRRVDGDTAPELVARARLRLDDRGTSALTCELRRDGVGADEWTGARGAARLALPHSFALATELELVIPDHSRGLGAVWPWGLAAIAWDNGTWQTAVAVEASASPQDLRRIDLLAQLGRRWGTR